MNHNFFGQIIRFVLYSLLFANSEDLAKWIVYRRYIAVFHKAFIRKTLCITFRKTSLFKTNLIGIFTQTTGVKLLTQMWLLSQKHFFLFCRKNLLLHMVMMKKVADRGFLAFWPFDNVWKFRKKCKSAAKNLKFGKKWVLPSQTLWNVWTYHHHTSYYMDHRFPIINTNQFVIHSCEFYLFLNRTVLSLVSSWPICHQCETIFFLNTTRLQFYCEYNCKRETALCLRIIIITW